MIQQGATVGACWEKVGQVWRRVRPYLLGFLVVLLVAGAIWALIYVPNMQVPVCPPGEAGLPPKICFDIENEARKTLAYILGGILAIIGIYMAHRRIRALERQVQIGQAHLQVAQEGQITERFTRAIEQLGSQEMAIRLGGIYALERIANDSDKDYWPIIETFTAYVRENASWREPPSDAPVEVAEEEAAALAAATTPVPAVPPKPATDIQAVLTVLGRRKYRYGQGEEQALDLRATDLRGINLSETHFEGADFRKAHLEKSNLWEAQLEEAVFVSAYLVDASLKETHLEGAILWWARMKGADLNEAHLEGADLTYARGLTWRQIDEAILDKKTILPDYLNEELPEYPGPEGHGEE